MNNSLKKNILFVCVENSCRSQIAEAFGHIYGNEHVEVYSAGSRPSGKVNPRAIESMNEIDYDLSIHHSKSLSEIPDLDYEYTITMGCGDECPFIKAKYREDWGIPDPKDMTAEKFREVRELIEGKVKDLLSKLKLRN